MALSAVEEAQLRDLIAQQAALLSLAGVEPTILSKLGATKVTLSALPTASVINDADLLLLRQGVTDKSTTASLIKNYIAAAFPVLAEQDYKSSVRLASTANVASISGLLTIDGVVTVAGNRVLLKDQSTASQNGIYVVAAGAWTRATDADTGTEFNGGAIIPVEEGATNADTNWQLTNKGTVTIGSTALTFADLNPNLGHGQTWQVLTGSRLLSTTYTNSTGRPIFVNVISSILAAGAALTIVVNGVPLFGTSYGVTATLHGSSCFAIVPPGGTYSAACSTGGNGTLISWAELR